MAAEEERRMKGAGVRLLELVLITLQATYQPTAIAPCITGKR